MDPYQFTDEIVHRSARMPSKFVSPVKQPAKLATKSKQGGRQGAGGRKQQQEEEESESDEAPSKEVLRAPSTPPANKRKLGAITPDTGKAIWKLVHTKAVSMDENGKEMKEEMKKRREESKNKRSNMNKQSKALAKAAGPVKKKAAAPVKKKAAAPVKVVKPPHVWEPGHKAFVWDSETEKAWNGKLVKLQQSPDGEQNAIWQVFFYREGCFDYDEDELFKTKLQAEKANQK